jgi:leukotriene-A4 hydrolase
VFREKSLDSYEFKSTILDFFSNDAEASKLLQELDWDTWFYSPGLPPKPIFDTSLVDSVYELARKWQSLPDPSFIPTEEDVKELTANQVVVFLERILGFEEPLTPDYSRLMGEVYGFAKSTNVEVVNLYFQIGLKAGDKTVIDPTVSLLGRVGRMKFVRPL